MGKNVYSQIKLFCKKQSIRQLVSGLCEVRLGWEDCEAMIYLDARVTFITSNKKGVFSRALQNQKPFFDHISVLLNNLLKILVKMFLSLRWYLRLERNIFLFWGSPIRESNFRGKLQMKTWFPISWSKFVNSKIYNFNKI